MVGSNNHAEYEENIPGNPHDYKLNNKFDYVRNRRSNVIHLTKSPNCFCKDSVKERSYSNALPELLPPSHRLCKFCTGEIQLNDLQDKAS